MRRRPLRCPTARTSPTGRSPSSSASSAAATRASGVGELLGGRRPPPIAGSCSARSAWPTRRSRTRRLGHPPAARARRAASARWSSSSRTSTGPSRPCSTCSSTSRPSRAARRCCSLCVARPELLERAPALGGAAARAGAARARAARRRRRRARWSRARRRGSRPARPSGSSSAPRATRCSSSSSSPSRRRPARALPPSIHAVLAARIDRLEPGERARARERLRRGPHLPRRRARASSCPTDERADLDRHLVALVRKRLIRADRPELAGRRRLPLRARARPRGRLRGPAQARRAELHERAGRWLAARPDARDEASATTSPRPTATAPSSAGRASASGRWPRRPPQRLGAGARAALERGDLPAAARLLERAAGLLAPATRPARRSCPSWARALFGAGRLAEADRVLSRGDRSRAAGDARLAARARVERALLALQAAPGAARDERRAGRRAALRMLERARRRARAVPRVVPARAGSRGSRARSARRTRPGAAPPGTRSARATSAELFDMLGWRASAARVRPHAGARGDPALRGDPRAGRGAAPSPSRRTLHPLAALHAMPGDFDEARRLVARGQRDPRRARSACSRRSRSTRPWSRCWPERPAAAEARLRAGYEQLVEMGEKALLATHRGDARPGGLRAGPPRRGGRSSARSSERSRGAEDDLTAQVAWRGVRAKLLAGARLRTRRTRSRARRSRWPSATDFPTVRADALLDLAEVLLAGGRPQRGGRASSRRSALLRAQGRRRLGARARALIPS